MYTSKCFMKQKKTFSDIESLSVVEDYWIRVEYSRKERILFYSYINVCAFYVFMLSTTIYVCISKTIGKTHISK